MNWLERRQEHFPKGPEVPETWAHKAPKPARSAHVSGPDTQAKYTPGALPAPFSGRFVGQSCDLPIHGVLLRGSADRLATFRI